MLTKLESELLASDLRQFPILAAASAAIKRCSTCTHGGRTSPNSILRAAITQLAHKKQFIQFIKTKTNLPAVIAGIPIREL